MPSTSRFRIGRFRISDASIYRLTSDLTIERYQARLTLIKH